MKTAKLCIIALSVILLCACAGTKSAQTSEEKNDENIFSGKLDKMPRFKGSDLDYFRTWVIRNIIYPKLDYSLDGFEYVVEKSVTASFVIEENGRLSDIKLISGVGGLLDNEVIRVLQRSPRWRPGRYRGEPVSVRIILTMSL